MTPFSISSLRVRLLLLVLLAVLPALGLMLYTAAEQRHLAAAQAQEDALRLVRQASSDQEQLIAGARQLLAVMTQLPEVRSGNTAACNALFAHLLEQYPLYAVIGMIKPDGDLLCCIPSASAPVNLADRAYFQSALQTRDFAIGDYQISRVTSKASLHFGYPVLNEAGQVQAVLFAALDLTWLDKLVAGAELPPGATLTVIDRNGTVLSRYPDAEKWAGKSVPEAPVIQTVLNRQGEGTVESTGVDGIPKFYAFRPLYSTAGGGDIYIYTGIPTEIVFAGADRMLARNLAGIGLVTALVFAIAWAGGSLFLLRRINVLLGATRRLAAGDLSARTGLPYGQGELGRLARAFDEMAEALEKLSRQNELILSSAGEGIIGLDRHGRTTFVNLAAARMLGYEVGELIARSNHAICHHSKPDGSSYPEEECPICAAYKDGLVHHVADEVFWRKDGTSFPVEYVSTPIWERGELAGAVVVFKDITERKRMEEALRRSEEHFRSLIENASDIITIIDTDGTIRYESPSVKRVFGYEPEELIGKNIFDLIHPEDVKNVINAFTHAVQNPCVVYSAEFRFRHKDGSWRVLDSAGKYLLDDPAVAGVVVNSRDITDRKQGEEALQESEEKCRAIFETTGTATAIFEEDTTISLVNTEFEKISGYSKEEIEGKKSWTEFFVKDDLERMKEYIACEGLIRMLPQGTMSASSLTGRVMSETSL